jgi:hypothetical protein
VTGESFQGAAYLNWDEAFLIYDEVVNSKATVARGEVEGRPFLDLALFWGSNGRGQPISSLRPEDADQHGRFYPATDDHSAVVHLPLAEYPDPVRAGPELRSILTRHGVSLKLNAASGTSEWLLPGAIGGGIAAALLALSTLALRRRTHRP